LAIVAGKENTGGIIMKARRWIFLALSSAVIVVGIAFTTFSLAWTQGRIDLATGFSIAITLIGAVGLFKTLKVSKTSPN
jgi:hypothetical protein